MHFEGLMRLMALQTLDDDNDNEKEKDDKQHYSNAVSLLTQFHCYCFKRGCTDRATACGPDGFWCFWSINHLQKIALYETFQGFQI